MRGHMDAAEYKHVVLGLVFLKYISDAFEERHAHLLKEAANPKSDLYVREERARYAVAEDRDEYTAENVFWVPKQARWSYLQANAKQPTIGKLIDEAMSAIESENPSLKGVLPRITRGPRSIRATRRTDRPDWHHRLERSGQALEGCARACV